MLRISGLRRTFGDTVALDDVSFDVPRGRLTGFLGPNGAGKTTTMRIVMGIVVPEAGEATWDGGPIELTERQRFGYMPEERGLYPKMRVAEQVEYLGRLHGLSRHDARERTVRWLERVGLTDRADSQLQELSQGNQQRVQLAAALVHDPELLVLDEPFSGLDPIAVEIMSDVLRERARDGVAVLFSSHQLDLVEDLCEDVAIIHDGGLVLGGSVAELKRQGRQRLLVGVDGSSTWADALAGVEVARTDAEGRTLLVLDETASPDTVLSAAMAAGRLTHFAPAPPSLAELFRDVVGYRPEAVEPTPTAAMS